MRFIFVYSTGQSLTSKEVKRLREELKRFYREEFSELKTSPLDPQSLRKLEQIYVHLVLLGERTGELPESVDYDRLFWIFSNKNEKSRIAFLGEAGVGKTTLLAKVAYDWALGKRLKKIDLVFFIRLREIGQNTDFAEIIKTFISDEVHLQNAKLCEYMRSHQRKIIILLDGLDEYKGDITQAGTNDDLLQIIRGDKFKRAPVVITTRPWKAEQITSIESINKKYRRIRIEGFTEQGVQEYIRKFFIDDTESAESLINLTTEESVVAKTMAPYPIFCSMLCHMWKWIKESDRERVRRLETFSQLIQEMINALVEQYASKLKVAGETLKQCQTRCKESFERIGEIAFHGLLVRQLTFNADGFWECKDAMKTGCGVGVLSSRKRVAPSDMRQRDGTEEISEVSFPHKLMQEYLAGYYLASLYRENPTEFEKLLRDKVFPEYEEFRYLLYFTAAHRKEDGQPGRHLMECLYEALGTNITNRSRTNVVNEHVDFLVDVAFECHDEEAIRPVTDLLRRVEYISLHGATERNRHMWSGYMYAFAACDIQPVSAVGHHFSIALFLQECKFPLTYIFMSLFIKSSIMVS